MFANNLRMARVSHVSLRTLASEAGVGTTTVCLALKNDPRLLPETRERIQRLAEEMGYRPNPILSGLMRDVRARRKLAHTETLAFLTSARTRSGWRQATIFGEYFEGARERANQLGYSFEEIWAKEPGMTGRRLTSILRARGIRGVLVAPLSYSHGHLTLEWKHFAVTTFGYSIRVPNLSRAVPYHFHNILMALRQLRRLGYKRIGLVYHRSTDERCNYQITAAETAFRGHKLCELFSLPCERIAEGKVFRTWLKKSKPDVLLCDGGNGVLELIAEMGLRVPEDIGFASLHVDVDKCYAGINGNGPLIGAAAIDVLAAQLYRNELGLPEFPNIVMVPGRWSDGLTVRKVGKTRAA